MNYSHLGEDYLEDRVNMESVDINELRGGDVFFYDLEKVNENNGRREYDYQGGFFSKGDIDIDLSDGEEIDNNLDIHVEQSWVDFSGKLWAEPISGDGYEGLKVVKQTIRSEGKVNASIDNTFDFNNTVNDTHWEVTKDIDMEWTLDLTLDYDGNNSWVLKKEKPTMRIPNDAEFNYSGEIDAKVDLDLQDNKGYNKKDVEEDIHEELSSEQMVWGTPSAEGYYSRAFSPLVGSANIGYYIAIDETVPLNGTYQKRMPLLESLFATNCQRDDFSTDKLYRQQYLDPMVLPGLGSFLGAGLQRSNATDLGRRIEAKVTSEVNAALQSMDFESEERREQWIEKYKPWIREEIWGNLLTKNLWGMDQQKGPSGVEPIVHGAIAFEPMGYFASQPLEQEEIETYNQDREQFFENELEEAAEKEKEESTDFAMAFTAIIAVLILCLVVIGYRGRKNR